MLKIRISLFGLVLGVLLAGTSPVLGIESESVTPVFIDSPGPVIINHCDSTSLQIRAVNPKTHRGESVRYWLVAGPGTIDERTGIWTFVPVAAGIRAGTFRVEVSAGIGRHRTVGSQDLTFSVEVLNRAPYVSPSRGQCGDTIVVEAGSYTIVVLDYGDSDRCDIPQLTIDSVSPAPVGSIGITYHGGREISFEPDFRDGGKIYAVGINITDGYSSAHCGVFFRVVSPQPFVVRIGTKSRVLPGTYDSVAVILDSGAVPLGGFQLLVSYDSSMMRFQGAQLGPALVDCRWEYFTYRFAYSDSCANVCPGGRITLIGMAETNNGPVHPVCNSPRNLPATLFTLHFLVTNDRTYSCTFMPIMFFWMNCYDNTMFDAGGYNLYTSLSVEEPEHPGVDISDTSAILPSYLGAPSLCTQGTRPMKRLIKFIDGGFELIDNCGIDATGDINQNGYPYEIADLVLFSRYFTSGVGVFAPYQQASIAASDINRNQTPLEVADFVSMYRIILGELRQQVGPPATSPNTAYFVYNSGKLILATTDTLGAVWLVFDGRLTPDLLQPGLKLRYSSDSSETRVFISMELLQSAAPILAGPLLNLVTAPKSVEAATRKGDKVISQILTPTDVADEQPSTLPNQYSLYQNYPNPFNPSTTIRFDLPRPAQVTCEILNVLGEIVWSQRLMLQSGAQRITWDGTDNSGKSVSSGVYYYRVSTADFSAARKMILLK